MIHADDLMVGNFVSVDGHVEKLTAVVPELCKMYEGISLTKELLFLFGYEQSSEQQLQCPCNLYYHLETKCVSLKDGDMNLSYEIILANDIEYLHQLQNVYNVTQGVNLEPEKMDEFVSIVKALYGSHSI